MGLREELQKRIERKHSEISELQMKIRDAEIYIQALEDTFKILPRESSVAESVDLRAGSRVAKARDFLRRGGIPQQVMTILEGIGEEANATNRAALSGSLSAYVRENRIFTRPSPNVFGLVEFSTTKKQAPPPNFGVDDGSEHSPEQEDLSWLAEAEEPKSAA